MLASFSWFALVAKKVRNSVADPVASALLLRQLKDVVYLMH